jgi:predicted alpha/beta superfamily hydrolase
LAFRELKKQKIALAGGKIDKFVVDDHTVEVWVPEEVLSYTPVLMMHDGKNIFNPKTSSNGKTPGRYSMPSEISASGETFKPIIIAVHGLSKETRMLELTPQEIAEAHPEIWDNLPDEYRPTSKTPLNAKYNELLAEKILPMVLEKYGIEHARERTAVAGASMGGLASIYLLSKYPNVFGAALGFSTHWILGHEYMWKELTDFVPEAGRHKIYTDTGTKDWDMFYQSLSTTKQLQLYKPKDMSETKILSLMLFRAPVTTKEHGLPECIRTNQLVAKRLKQLLNRS